MVEKYLNNIFLWKFTEILFLQSFVTTDCFFFKFKVSATTSLAPTVDLSSAQTITKLFFLEQLNLPKVDERVTPYDEATPPLIILCGPSAVKKVALSLLVVEKAPARVSNIMNK